MPIKTAKTTNPFFLFLLNAQQDQSKKSPIQISIKHNRDGVPYVFIPFSAGNQQLFIDESFYQVIENHITAFEGCTDFSKNSEYHYTATLHDEAGLTYKLRCYFDGNNNPIDDLVLKLIETDNEIEIPIPTQSERVLKMWVQAEASNLIRPLVIKQTQKINALKNSFNDEIALSTEYFETNKNSIEALQSLKNQTKKLTQKERKIQQLEPSFKSPLLHHLKDNIEWRMAELQMNSARERQEESQRNAKPSIGNVAISAPVPQASKQKKKAKPKAIKKKNVKLQAQSSDFDREFVLLQQRIVGVLDLGDKLQQATSLMSLYADVQAFAGTIELVGSPEEAKAFSYPAQAMINQLLSHMHELMNQSITENLPHVFMALLPFTKLAPMACLTYAIDSNDQTLINGVFSHYAYAVNRISLPLPSTGEEVSPLIYAYEVQSPHAFEALLKHLANPFEISSNHLPLIHHILHKPTDMIFYPLMLQAIYELGHIPILTQLNAILDEQLKTNSGLSDSEKSTLRTAIRDYDFIKQAQLPTSSKVGAKIARSNAHFVSEMTQCIDPKLLKELEVDEEFQFIKQQYLSAQQTFLHSLSKVNFHKLNAASKNIVSLAVDNKQFVQSAMSRESIITILQSYTEMFPMQTRMLEIQKIAGNSRSNTAAKQLQREARQLEHNINQLQETIANAGSKATLKSFSSKLETILETAMEMLSGMMAPIEKKQKGSDSDSEFGDVDFYEVAMADEQPSKSKEEPLRIMESTDPEPVSSVALTLANSMSQSILSQPEKAESPELKAANTSLLSNR